MCNLDLRGREDGDWPSFCWMLFRERLRLLHLRLQAASYYSSLPSSLRDPLTHCHIWGELWSWLPWGNARFPSEFCIFHLALSRTDSVFPRASRSRPAPTGGWASPQKSSASADGEGLDFRCRPTWVTLAKREVQFPDFWNAIMIIISTTYNVRMNTCHFFITFPDQRRTLWLSWFE